MRLRHLTFFLSCLATDRAGAKIVFDHWIVTRTGSSELIASEDVADIEQYDGKGEYTEDDTEHFQKLHMLEFEYKCSGL